MRCLREDVVMERARLMDADVECHKCHRQFTITYRKMLKIWRWKVRFCPFCGNSTEGSEVDDFKLFYELDTPDGGAR